LYKSFHSVTHNPKLSLTDFHESLRFDVLDLEKMSRPDQLKKIISKGKNITSLLQGPFHGMFQSIA